MSRVEVTGMDLAIDAKARDYILARGGVAHLVSFQGISLC